MITIKMVRFYQDKYILGSMGLMHGVSVWHALLTRAQHDPDTADQLDNWAFVVFVTIFCVYNVGFTVYMLFQASRA